MTDTPTPETDAKLAAATEESSATHSPPSDWPAFARALEIQRNAARAQRNELDEVWAKVAECRAALEMIASADGATTPGTAAWASAEIARAALATLSK